MTDSATSSASIRPKVTAVFPSFVGAVTVFTGSASGNVPGFMAAAKRAATILAQAGIKIIYGGGNTGLMGAVADAALAVGGQVHGVTTVGLKDTEVAHEGLSTLEVAPDMHARKVRMANLGDAFVAFPGGAGTLEEFFEVWTWQQLGIHAKPVALLNVNGFWDGLLKAIDQMIVAGFLRPEYRETLIVADNADELLDKLGRWQAPTAKWAKAS